MSDISKCSSLTEMYILLEFMYRFLCLLGIQQTVGQHQFK